MGIHPQQTDRQILGPLRPLGRGGHRSGRDVVVATPAEVPVIIFSGVPSESAELERLRPRTRLIEKPYSLVLLVETLEEMMAESGSQNLHS